MAGARTYRTRLPLRVAVMAAALVWAGTLALLVQFPDVAPRTLWSATAFLVFFIVFSAYYDRLAITVTGDGIVVSRLWNRVPVRFEDILRIEVHQGFAGTMYDVLTRRGLVQFSSLFARHQELFDLLLEKAELQRRG